MKAGYLFLLLIHSFSFSMWIQDYVSFEWFFSFINLQKKKIVTSYPSLHPIESWKKMAFVFLDKNVIGQFSQETEDRLIAEELLNYILKNSSFDYEKARNIIKLCTEEYAPPLSDEKCLKICHKKILKQAQEDYFKGNKEYEARLLEFMPSYKKLYGQEAINDFFHIMDYLMNEYPVTVQKLSCLRLLYEFDQSLATYLIQYAKKNRLADIATILCEDRIQAEQWKNTPLDVCLLLTDLQNNYMVSMNNRIIELFLKILHNKEYEQTILKILSCLKISEKSISSSCKNFKKQSNFITYL